MKFGQLILRRIVEIIATNVRFWLKCTKIDFGCLQIYEYEPDKVNITVASAAAAALCAERAV